MADLTAGAAAGTLIGEGEIVLTAESSRGYGRFNEMLPYQPLGLEMTVTL